MTPLFVCALCVGPDPLCRVPGEDLDCTKFGGPAAKNTSLVANRIFPCGRYAPNGRKAKRATFTVLAIYIVHAKFRKGVNIKTRSELVQKFENCLKQDPKCATLLLAELDRPRL